MGRSYGDPRRSGQARVWQTGARGGGDVYKRQGLSKVGLTAIEAWALTERYRRGGQ